MNVRELIFLGWKIFKIVISHISSNTKFNNFEKKKDCRFVVPHLFCLYPNQVTIIEIISQFVFLYNFINRLKLNVTFN